MYILLLLCVFLVFFRAGSVGDTKKMGWKSKKGMALGSLDFCTTRELGFLGS